MIYKNSNDLKSKSHLLPYPLSSHLENNDGEIILLIDSWFSFVGSLFLAEYLDTGAKNSEYNRWLFYLLEQKRPITLGQWVAIGRLCKIALSEIWKTGRVATWPNMPLIDFGASGDIEHPVSQLLSYRNQFCHGSFSEIDTNTHFFRQLIEIEILKLANDLAVQPLRLIQANGSVLLLQGSRPKQYTQLSNEIDSKSLPFGTVYTQLISGEIRLLSPALQCAQFDSIWGLSYSRKEQPIDFSFAQRFQENLDRYRLECEGDVFFGGNEVPITPVYHAQIHSDGLASFIGNSKLLTLISYRSGTGQYRLAEHLYHLATNLNIPVTVWRVIHLPHLSHPARSGKVFAKALLRQAEQALDLQRLSLELNNADLLELVIEAGNKLTDAGMQVMLIVMDADTGRLPQGSDTFSVLDVCKTISSTTASGFRIILLDKMRIATTLPHDNQTMVVPPPDLANIDMGELVTEVENWCQAHPIRLPLLECILTNNSSWPSFENQLSHLVDSLKNSVKTDVFAPSVEHALWTAASFLQRTHVEDGEYYWTVPDGLDSSYALALRNALTIIQQKGKA